MYRFALRGRWLAGLVAVLLVAAVCVRLGIWQLDRRHQRLGYNARVETQAEAEPAPLAAALDAASGDPAEAEFRRVIVEGTYDASRQFLVLAQSYQGSPGEHVVTPLLLADGRAVLVNRGFVPVTDPRAAVPGDAAPPAGSVIVAGTFRAPEEGGRVLDADPEAEGAGTVGFLTRVDVDAVADHVPYDLVPGWVRVEAERPDRQGVPIPLLPPEPGEGPHLPYAVQWFTFATIFLVGWGVLVHRQARRFGLPSGNGRRRATAGRDARV